MTLAFARIRVSLERRDAIISTLRTFSEIREIAAFRDEGIYGLFIEVPQAELSEFRNKLSTIEDVTIEDFIVQREIGERIAQGGTLERTILQFGQVATA